MRHYWRVILSFLKIGLVKAIEFRLNFLVWFLIGLFWAATVLLSIDWTFNQVRTIAGWSRGEVLVLTAVNMLFVTVISIFVVPSMQYLSDSIRHGDLDFYIAKPINLRVMMSVIKFEPDNYLRNVVYFLLVVYFLNKFNFSPSILDWTGFLTLFFIGLFIFYNIFFIIAVSSFWLVNVSNAEFLFESILDSGRFPVNIFRGSLKVIFYYLIPLGFVATFPTQILIGKGSGGIYVFAIVIAVALFIFSQWFWNFALKHYSSASS